MNYKADSTEKGVFLTNTHFQSLEEGFELGDHIWGFERFQSTSPTITSRDRSMCPPSWTRHQKDTPVQFHECERRAGSTKRLISSFWPRFYDR